MRIGMWAGVCAVLLAGCSAGTPPLSLDRGLVVAASASSIDLPALSAVVA